MTPRRPVSIPPGSWPPRMQADMAAGYCGEKHVEDFLERVGTTYPSPRVVDSMRRKFWYRDDLDRAMQLGGIDQEPAVDPSEPRKLTMGEKFAAGFDKKRREREEAKQQALERRAAQEALKDKRRQDRADRMAAAARKKGDA